MMIKTKFALYLFSFVLILRISYYLDYFTSLWKDREQDGKGMSGLSSEDGWKQEALGT